MASYWIVLRHSTKIQDVRYHNAKPLCLVLHFELTTRVLSIVGTSVLKYIIYSLRILMAYSCPDRFLLVASCQPDVPLCLTLLRWRFVSRL